MMLVGQNGICQTPNIGIKITSFKINNQDKEWIDSICKQKPLDLPWNYNDIIVSFTSKDSVVCFLEGFDKKEVNYGSQKWVRFAGLGGGNFTLILREKNNKSNTIKIPFTLEKVAWRKVWFIPSLLFYGFALFGILLYFIFQYRLRQQLRLQSVRHELEIKALRAQMNPHFIFNCMNTIDAYILRKRFLEASDYLQKFSKLIRKILENSENQTISIEQEIQTLKLYIELEQERFSDSFSYVLDIQPELQENDYQIPSLVLQPFVENAILHGIRHLTERRGEIVVRLHKIEVKDKEPILHCQIQDNGIGRKASGIINQQRQANHKSMGVNVTLERISTYQAIYGNRMETTISDLEVGTLVEIKLPLLLNP
jgi:hypothetical protein